MNDTDYRELARSTRESSKMAIAYKGALLESLADAIDALLAEREKLNLIIAGTADPFIAISSREEIRTELIQSLSRKNAQLRKRLEDLRNDLICTNRPWNEGKKTCLEVDAKGPYECDNCSTIKFDDLAAKE